MHTYIDTYKPHGEAARDGKARRHSRARGDQNIDIYMCVDGCVCVNTYIYVLSHVTAILKKKQVRNHALLRSFISNALVN